MSASAEDEYFSDGLTEELTTALAKAGLRVAPRSSAFSYKGKTVNVKDVGKALNVSTVMEGTVRRAGNRLRLTATLSATSDGLTLWSESYEKEVKDVFQVQDEVATAMVSALKVHLAAGQTVAGAKGRGTQDPEAYDLYLRGRFQVRKRGEPALRQAAILFQQAIDRDPKFARAYAGLGDAIGLLPFWSNAPVDSAAPLALAAIDRATTLEPTLVEAHATRGLVLELQYQWNEAERAFRRTIELDPQYASAYQWLGEFLLSVGREDEAVATIHKAIELDPLSPAAWNAYVIALTVAGQDSAAIAAGRRELEIDPNLPVIHHDIAAAYAKSGRWMEALREEEQVADDQRNHLIRAIYLGKNGRRREAQEILRRAEESAVHVRGTAADIARLAFGLDDIEKAMGWFIRSAEAHETFWANDPDLRPYFDRLRSHQRFPELLRKTNLETQPVAKPRSAAR